MSVLLEPLFLFLVAGGIAAYARGRGGNPWVWGAVAISGYVFAEYVLPAFIRIDPDSDLRMAFFFGGFAWMGGVALSARYLLGRGRKKASSMWTCPNCKYLNQRYAVICEACQRPYGDPET